MFQHDIIARLASDSHMPCKQLVSNDRQAVAVAGWLGLPLGLFRCHVLRGAYAYCVGAILVGSIGEEFAEPKVGEQHPALLQQHIGWFQAAMQYLSAMSIVE